MPRRGELQRLILQITDIIVLGITSIIVGLDANILGLYKSPKNKFMSTLYPILLILHIAAGSLSFLTGSLNMILPKAEKDTKKLDDYLSLE